MEMGHMAQKESHHIGIAGHYGSLDVSLNVM